MRLYAKFHCSRFPRRCLKVCVWWWVVGGGGGGGWITYPLPYNTSPRLGAESWSLGLDCYNMFLSNLIFIPINYVNPKPVGHWCLAVVNVDQKSISYYDSTGGIDHTAIKNIQNYLVLEYRNRYNSELEVGKWSLVYPSNIPLQNDRTECGVFVCMYAEHLSRKAPLNFTVADTPNFRTKMKYEIIKNQLVKPPQSHSLYTLLTLHSHLFSAMISSHQADFKCQSKALYCEGFLPSLSLKTSDIEVGKLYSLQNVSLNPSSDTQKKEKSKKGNYCALPRT